MGWYDVAQVCPNGHVVNDSIRAYPKSKQAFCAKCGEKTLTACPRCNKVIQGDYHSEYVLALGNTYTPPAFCQYCGSPFPWTERKQQAAMDLFIDEIQEEKEREEFRQSLEQISKDSPQAHLASNRIVRLLKKVRDGTALAIRDILVDIASEAAKKTLFPGP